MIIPVSLGLDVKTTEIVEPIKAISNDGGLMQSAWPMYGHDTRHTGRSPYSTENNSGVKLWEFQTEYLGFESSPAIDSDGIIYIGSNEGYLHAFYPNGTEKWRADCEHWVTSSPAIAEDGTIYVGSWDDHLYAINPDGTRKWRYDAIETIRSSPVIGEDGIIYFGALGPGLHNGRAYALYPNGTEKWHFDTGFWIYTSFAIGDDGTIYVPSDDNYLYALYPHNGTCKWKYGLGDGTGTPSIADDGTIYVSSYDGFLHALYPNNGTLKWKHGIGSGTGKIPSIGNEGTIYIGKTNLVAINSDGTRKWTYHFEEGWEVTTSVAISVEEALYFGITKNGIYKADLVALNSDGTLKWRVEGISNRWIHSNPVIDEDGILYVGTDWDDYGKLYAFGGGNRPPEKPVIYGEIEGRIGKYYNYTFVSTDYEGSEIWYYIEWGDGKDTGWIGPYDAGDTITLNHRWHSKDTYFIRAKAKDNFDEESSWATMEISIPRTRVWQGFLDMFPLLHKLLNLIL